MRVAVFVMVEPIVLVKTALYCFPLSDKAAVKVYVDPVAPEISPQLLPTGNTCHCSVGEGLPVAPALKVAVLPSVTV